MWEQEGGEIMLVAPVCLCAYVSVCIAHVSGYAAHRKQTATNPLHTRGKTTTHTRPIADTKKAKHTHTNKTSLKQYPVHPHFLLFIPPFFLVTHSCLTKTPLPCSSIHGLVRISGTG